ncbi:signal peptidase I [Rubellimicrobium aerolatum]|uniref:Signal peptidase I n=1 Tax=Rubellimicrobium aerolatum TaxID=490979 RepID=A0ABW0SD18_9RHOB|nr:signal peptidase I [Rubellimicrobium aerolatum]MBP1806727.1 signal peptidase I [Rubellimicrobium aerolatum]
MAFGRDRRAAAQEERSALGSVWETVKTVFWALLIAGVFRTLFFQPFWIPSGSMKDTLLIGDFLFVNKMAYGYSYASCPSIPLGVIGLDIGADDLCGWADGDNTRIWGGEPQRGDVVVFRHPVNGTDFIKRLVGLPGDRIQVRDGVLNIDVGGTGTFQPVALEPAGQFRETYEPQGPQGLRPSCIGGAQPEGGECLSDRWRETLPGTPQADGTLSTGVSHGILDIGDLPQDSTGVYTVPAGHFFFMGDNRDNSTDSRFAQPQGVGFVPFENLVGRADRIMFSSAGRSMLAFWTWRADRFFRAIQ